MRLKTLKQVLLAGSVAILSALPLTSYAGAISGNVGQSTEATGSDFTGFLAYNATTLTTATLTVTLTNTSDPALINSFITAFVFNNPDNLITGVTLAPGTNFSLIGGTTFNNTINGSPFGDFDIGASTGGAFQGGGNPTTGIGIGETEVFTFSFTGTNLTSLSQAAFEAELSANAGGGGAQFFVGRFRGVGPNAEDSDKVPGQPNGNGTVPEPGTLSLAGLGLLGTLMMTRRQRKVESRKS